MILQVHDELVLEVKEDQLGCGNGAGAGDDGKLPCPMASRLRVPLARQRQLSASTGATWMTSCKLELLACVILAILIDIRKSR